MKKACPACHQEFKRSKVFTVFRDNFKAHRPVFSFPCPHCGARLRNTRWPWRMTWMGVLIMGLDGLQVTMLDMYFLPWAHRNLKVIVPLAIAFYGLAMVLMFGGINAQRYEILPDSNGGRFSRGEMLGIMAAGSIVAVQLLLLIFYAAGYGYQ